jgi:alpha-tubulin suppressor-like RCC1 family protein
MSSIGSLLVAGRSAGGAWAEIQECGGVRVRNISNRATVVTSAAGGGGGPTSFSVTGRAPLSASPQVQHAARTVLFERVAESKDFLLALTALGQVYFHGRGPSGVPGVTDTIGGAQSPSSPSSPIHIPTLDGIVAVAAGEAHCVALRADGTVYTWGYNSCGQTGVGSTSDAGRLASECGKVGFRGTAESALAAATRMAGAGQYVAVPRFVSSLHKVRVASVACGARHTLFVTDEGELYACGEGTSGQLGLGRKLSSSAYPQLVNIRERSYASPSDAMVHTARSMELLGGEAGAEAEAEGGAGSSGAPNPLAAVDPSVVAVAAGFGHSVALTRSGHVFTFGLNCYGQLGVGDTASRFAPALVFLLAKEEGGGLSPMGIGADDDADGDVVASSMRGHKLQPFVASAVAAGSYHTAFLGADARLYTCGSSGDGRLGQAHMEGPAGGVIMHTSAAAAAAAGLADGDGDGSILTAEIGGGGLGDGGSTALLPDGEGGLSPSGSYASSAPQQYTHRWGFPRGVGPLAAPYPGSVPPAFKLPPHYARNASREALPPPPTYDPATGRPNPELVRDGTWTVPMQRTPSHLRMIKAGKSYGLELASGALKTSYDARNVGEDDITFQASAAVLAANPRHAPEVLGKPWLRKPRPTNTDAPVTIPTPVQHPILDTRRITRIACAEAETVVFSRACPNFRRGNMSNNRAPSSLVPSLSLLTPLYPFPCSRHPPALLPARVRRLRRDQSHPVGARPQLGLQGARGVPPLRARGRQVPGHRGCRGRGLHAAQGRHRHVRHLRRLRPVDVPL